MIGYGRWVMGLVLAAMVVMGIWIDPAIGWAETNSTSLKLNVKEEFQDNSNFNQTREADWIMSVSPEIAFSRKADMFEITLNAGITSHHYRDNGGLDEIDQAYRTGMRYFTERLSIAGNYDFTVDSQKNRDLEETGIIMANSVRNRHSGNASAGYTLSERSSVGLNLGIADDAYEEAEDSDLTSQTASAFYSRQITEKTGIQMHTGFSRDEYETVAVSGHTLFLRGIRAVTEKLKGSADIGIQYTVSDFEALWFFMEDERYSRWDWIGKVDLSYAGEFWSGTMAISKGIQTASGTGGSSERTQASGSLTYRLLENTTVSHNQGYTINTSQSGELSDRDLETRSWDTGFGIRHMISPDWSLGAFWRYIHEQDMETDIITTGNEAWLQVGWQHDFLH